MTKANRGGMPTAKRVREYWSLKIYKLKGFDSPEEFLEDEWCFACGLQIGKARPERAHIIAVCDGGSNDVSNIHMLCEICHKDSEFLTISDYWEWFFERSALDMVMSGAARKGVNLSCLLSIDS